MAKATTTIKQVMNYQPDHAAWFATNQSLFNQLVAFYFAVIQAHEKIVDLKDQDALTALEKLTHTTAKNPTPIMPLSEIAEDIPAMFRSGGPRSMRPLAPLARSFPISTNGVHVRPKRWPKANRSWSDHLFPTFLEQIRHPVSWPMEGAHWLLHPAQSLDRNLLELDQSAAHGPGTACGC